METFWAYSARIIVLITRKDYIMLYIGTNANAKPSLL